MIDIVELSPQTLEEKDIKKYLDSISCGIKKENTKNIAITGGFSSGKSSILKTFKEKNPEKKYLDLSLADFGNNDDDNNGNDDNDGNNDNDGNIKNVEIKIVQQMIYSVKNEKIPFSRFKKLEKFSYSWKEAFCTSFIMMLYYFYFRNQELFLTYLSLKEVSGSTVSVQEYVKILKCLRLIIIPITFIILPILVKKLVYLFKRIKINNFKIKMSNIEIETQKKDEDFFDKNLDEILYYFECTEVDVVLIEDLDRIKNAQKLFIKLRELCSLINNSEQVKKKITFIYALGNDVFPKGEEQTKFFDLIIPIVPIVHYSNSEIIFTKRAKKHPEISSEFIQDISLYVDDIRIINNIFNEFSIYKRQLKITDKLSINKLFGILIYKSMYPIGYSKLLKKEGTLYHIFSRKKKYTEELNKEIEIKLKEQNEKIENSNKESLKNISEINTIAIFELLKTIMMVQHSNSPLSSLKLNGYSLSSIDYEKFELSEETIIDVYSYRDTCKFFSVIDEKISYSERIKNIKLKDKKERKKMEDEIEKLKTLKLKNTHLKISQIIQNKKEVVIKDLENVAHKNNKVNVAENDMLFYLLRKGYIAEDYDMFISYINSEALDNSTFEYLKAVKNQKCLDFSHEINEEKIARLLEKLNFEDFNEDAILNYRLLKYLLKTPINQTNWFFNKLKDKNEKTIKFINFSVEELTKFETEEEEILEKFILKLYESWNNIWGDIQSNNLLSEEDKNRFFYLIIKYIKIENLSEDEEIKNTLKNKSNFTSECLRWTVPDKKISSILSLDIKFKNLEFSGFEDLIFEEIINGNYYEINFNNIEKIFQYKNIETSNLKNKNYTEIQNSGYIELINYIEDNFEEYFKNVLLSIMETNREESLKILKRIVKKDEIEDGHKLDFLLKQEQILESLKLDDEELEKNLLKHEKIKVSWENIIYYYENRSNQEIDKILTDYLNTPTVYENLDMLPELENKLDQKIQKDICENEEITVVTLKNYIEKFSWKLSDYEFCNLSDEKLELIIKKGIICLTTDYVKELKEKESNLHIQLIINNFEDFIENESDYNLELDDYQKIFKSEKNIENKKKLVPTIESLIENEESEISKDFLQNIWEFIKENKFNKCSEKLINSCIKNNILKLSYENIVFLRDMSEELERKNNYVVQLCSKNIYKFLENVDSYKLLENEYIELIESISVNDESLIKLLEGIKLMLNEFSSEFFKRIYKVILEKKESAFPSELMTDLLKIGYEELTENKIEVLSDFIKKLSPKELVDIFNSLSEEYRSILLNKKWAKLSNTEPNLKLIVALKEKELISSFSEEEGNTIKINKKNGVFQL